MAKRILEMDVKSDVKKLLDKHKWFWFMPPAGGYGRSGISDFLCLRDGVFMVVETKVGKGKPTAMQVGFLNSIVAESGFAFIISEKTLAWFAEWLDAFDRSVQAAAKREPPSQVDGATMLNAIREMLP